jgi:hypothetical protein
MYVVRHSFHALYDDTLAFPLWNLQELLPDLLFIDVLLEKVVADCKACD